MLGAASFAATAQELRLSTFVPPVRVICREILTPWAQEVAKATNGEVKVMIVCVVLIIAFPQIALVLPNTMIR